MARSSGLWNYFSLVEILSLVETFWFFLVSGEQLDNTWISYFQHKIIVRLQEEDSIQPFIRSRVFLYCKPVNLKTLIYIFKCNCRLELVNSTFLMMQISDTTIERSEIKFIYPRISQKPRQNRHRHRIARARLLRVIVFLCFTSHESSIPECIENMCWTVNCKSLLIWSCVIFSWKVQTCILYVHVSTGVNLIVKFCYEVLWVTSMLWEYLNS